MSILSEAHFHEEVEAIKYLESVIWPNGAICPHCRSGNKIYELNGKYDRPGLKKCGNCRKTFTVKVGTVYESSHIPVHKWLQATYLLSASKKGCSAHQLHRMIGVTYKTAWFMFHRIREGMATNGGVPPLGGGGKTVEADETYVGGLERNRHRSKRKNLGTGWKGKEIVFSLVERDGKVRSTHVKSVNAETLRPVIKEQLHADSRLMTDEAGAYKGMGKHFEEHHVVRHGIGEYVRGGVHTNTIESYFATFKRGMKGIYQHCKADHLKRYLAEFDFRYNERSVSDVGRAQVALQGIVGKRLTYRRIDREA